MLKSLLLACFSVFLLSFSLPASAQVQLPYSEDFESGPGLWTPSTANPTTAWQYGTPAFATTTTAHSGSFCWDINLTTPYGNSANAMLTSPDFLINSNFAEFAFWQNLNTETGWDGMHVQYSLNGGPWSVLGNVGSIEGTNWYNDPQLNSNNLPAWTASTPGWVRSSFRLNNMNGSTIRLRFVFVSDPAAPGVGVSIDDITLNAVSVTDLGITSFTLPPFVNAGTLSDSICVSIQNQGSGDLTGFTVGYTVNGITTATQVYSGILSSGDSATVCLPGYVTSSGTNQICGVVNVAGDTDSTDNSSCGTLFLTTVLPLDYGNNFDSVVTEWSVVTPGNLQTTWELGTPQVAPTNYAYSPFSCWDVNLNTLYSPLANTHLYSPVFDLSGSVLPQVSFYLNLDAENDWDGLRLEYSPDQGQTWLLLGSPGDPNATNWYNFLTINSSNLPAWSGTSNGFQYCKYKLSALGSLSTIRFRFIFTSDNSIHQSGVSLDNFAITSAPANDAQAVSDVLPAQLISGSNQALSCRIRNEGAQPITSLPVRYSLNGQAAVTTMFTGTLLPGDSATVSLGNFTVPAGPSQLKIYTDLGTDMNHSNDTVYRNFTPLPTAPLPYFNDFSSLVNDWTSTSQSGNSWQHGVPNYGATSSIFSPPYCWDINLNIPYSNGAYNMLTSPVFEIGALQGLHISFMTNYNTSVFQDGVVLQYSHDGTNWTPLGGINDPNGQNWYNGAIYASPCGWSGNSNGWTNMRYVTNQFAGQNYLQLRFLFTSDFVSPNGDGFSMDDFEIRPQSEFDAAVTSILTPAGSVSSTAMSTVSIRMKNTGTQTLTNVPVRYLTDNTNPVDYIWSGNLAADSGVTISFPAQTFSGGQHSIKAFINWPQDEFAGNDTVVKDISSILTVTPPYYNNFDTGNSDFVPQSIGLPGTAWEFGVPTFGATNQAYSAPFCWDINLVTSYNNVARVYLYSPVFDLTPALAFDLQFRLNYNTETNADIVFLEYTTDDVIWNLLGSVNDPAGTNWYNTQLQNRQGWSGTSQGWIMPRYQSNTFAGAPYFRLRFAFHSDLSLISDGASMDDFSLSILTRVNESEQPQIRIFPNPASSVLNLSGIPAGTKNVQVRDAAGRIILTKTVSASSDRLDIASLAAGMYFLSLENMQGVQLTSRFIVGN